MLRLESLENPQHKWDLFMDFIGFIWFYMVLYGFIWFYMVLYGFIWFYMVLYGFIWFYMVLYGFIWFYMVLWDLLWRIFGGFFIMIHRDLTIMFQEKLKFLMGTYPLVICYIAIENGYRNS